MSKDDEYWHTVMDLLGDEFIQVGRSSKDPRVGEAWVAAGKEVKATANQALKTAGTAERLISGKPN